MLQQVEKPGHVGSIDVSSYNIDPMAVSRKSHRRLSASIRPQTRLLMRQPSRQQYGLARAITRPDQHLDHLAHLVHPAQPAHGNLLAHARHGVLIGDHARPRNHGGRDVVERDAGRPEARRQVLHHRAQAALARRVVAPVDAGARRGDAADAHHAAPACGLHARHGGLGQDEGRAQVDLQRVLKVGERDVAAWSARRSTSAAVSLLARM